MDAGSLLTARFPTPRNCPGVGKSWAKGRSFKAPICPVCKEPWQKILETRDTRKRPVVGQGLLPAHDRFVPPTSAPRIR